MGFRRLRSQSAASISHAAHLVLMSSTIAVVTSAVINLRIIAESLNPHRNPAVAKASHFSIHSCVGLSHSFVFRCKREIKGRAVLVPR